MLKIESFVPNVYVKKSRDFQMFCKVLEIIANGAKYQSDTITDCYNPYICNNRMLDLLSTLYNYNSEKEISDHDLRMILTNYPYLIKHKGTRAGIEAAVSLTAKLTGKNVSWSCDYINKDENNNAVHKVIVTMSDTYDERYLKEFMNLVLPVGFEVESSISGYHQAATNVSVKIVTERDTKTSDSVSSVVKVSDVGENKLDMNRVEVVKGE